MVSTNKDTKRTSFSYTVTEIRDRVKELTSYIARRNPELSDNIILSSDDDGAFDGALKETIAQITTQLRPFQRGIDVPVLDRVPFVIYPAFDNQKQYKQGDKVLFNNVLYQAKADITFEAIILASGGEKLVGMPIGNTWANGVVANVNKTGSIIDSALICESVPSNVNMNYSQALARENGAWKIPTEQELTLILKGIPDFFTDGRNYWSSTIYYGDRWTTNDQMAALGQGSLFPETHSENISGVLCRTINYGFTASEWDNLGEQKDISSLIIFNVEDFEWQNLNQHPTTDTYLLETLINGIAAHWFQLAVPELYLNYKALFDRKLLELSASINSANLRKRRYTYP